MCCNSRSNTSTTGPISDLNHTLKPVNACKATILTACSCLERTVHSWSLWRTSSSVCASLTPVNRRAHLQWSHQQRNWTPNKWRNVLFKDESRSRFHTDSPRVFIWREHGTWLHPGTSWKWISGRALCWWTCCYCPEVQTSRVAVGPGFVHIKPTWWIFWR